MKYKIELRLISAFLLGSIFLSPVSQNAVARSQRSEITIQGVPGRESVRAVQSLADIVLYDVAAPLASAIQSPPFLAGPEESSRFEAVVPLLNAPAAITASSPAPASSFVALQDNISSIPPDTHGAVGPGHLMTTLNSQVRIQDRNGANLSTVSLSSFWSSVNLGSGTPFDPKVLYDPYQNRWMFVACDDARSSTSAVLIAVSNNSDPTGFWYFYRVQLNDGTNWIDYPSFGFNKNWIVASVNIFTSGGSYVRTNVYAFDKAALYQGLSAPYTKFETTSFTMVPAITHDNALETEYLVNTFSDSSGIIRMARITGAVGSETLTQDTTNITAPLSGWSSSPVGGNDFAPQLGSVKLIQTNDHRMQNLVYRNGSLWTTHTIFLPSGGSPTRSSVQWWQINPAGYSVIQNGRIDDPSGVNFYAFPSIAVNKSNDVLIGFSRFSATQYASGNYAFRSSTDPLNTLRADVVLKAGEAPYFKMYSGTRNRWGDYSNTVVDPLNDTDFWTIQEYAWTNDGFYDRWGTWWGRVIPPGDFSKSSPTDAATGQSTSPTLSWGNSSGATLYEYCYDTTDDDACAVPWTSALTNTQATLSGLTRATTYYWQVRAVSAYTTTYANDNTWWSFNTADVPAAFSKSSPGNAATGQPITPTLSWGSSAGATSYEYCYDTTNDNACAVTWTNALTNTQASLSSLATNTTYFWQIRAVNAYTMTYADSNTWWSFTTAGIAPGAFSKNSPGDGATGLSTSPTLSWSSSAGASTYEYCFDTTNDNICSVSWTNAVTSTQASLNGLAAGTTYYWQVRATNTWGTTAANANLWWSFKTQSYRIYLPMLIRP
jgi:hypothetical protein